MTIKTFVVIPFSKEVMVWLEENCELRYAYAAWSEMYPADASVINFSCEEDATAFKLRFGNVIPFPL